MAQAPRDTLTARQDTANNQHLLAAGDGDIPCTGGDEGPAEPVGDGAPPPVMPGMATSAPPPAAEGECYTPRIWNAENINQADPLLQTITPADERLITVYGDTIHQNDGSHLDG